jgi:trigger factor
VKVTKESVSATEVTLAIEMDSDDEEPFIDRSYRRSVGRLQIPGFRKGKAPRSIVETYVGRAALLQEALEFMIPETLDRVLKDEDLQAFVEPSVEITEIEPVSFTAVVPLEPVVDLGDYQSLRIEQEPSEITDEQIDQVVEQLRQQAAPWEPVERPIQFGDLLNLNVHGEIDGEEVVNDQGVDYLIQEENVLPFPGFAPYLEGLNESESREFTLAIPEDYPRPQFAGKDCQFQVEVLSVKEKKLPELDDEFAKGIGEGFDTMEALTDHVTGLITQQSEAEARQQLEIQSLEQLVDMASIQASDTLYQRELEMMQREREQSLQRQRWDMPTYLQFLGKTEEEFLDELRPTANDRLARFLVMRKLSQEEAIDVTDEEVMEDIENTLESMNDVTPQMRRVMTSEVARDRVRTSMLNRKILERLVEIVQGQEPGGAAADPEESPAPATAEQPAPDDDYTDSTGDRPNA